MPSVKRYVIIHLPTGYYLEVVNGKPTRLAVEPFYYTDEQHLYRLIWRLRGVEMPDGTIIKYKQDKVSVKERVAQYEQQEVWIEG